MTVFTRALRILETQESGIQKQFADYLRDHPVQNPFHHLFSSYQDCYVASRDSVIMTTIFCSIYCDYINNNVHFTRWYSQLLNIKFVLVSIVSQK